MRRRTPAAAGRPERGSPRPFSLPGDGGGRGVLLLHGFTGTPFEVGLLGADLSARGLACDAPLLAGHGADADALARTTWADWLGSAEAALLALRDRLAAAGQPPRLAVVGLSMGGLLALELCRRRPELLRAGCFLATPLWLPGYQMRAISALARSRLRGLKIPKLAGSDVRDREMGLRNPATPAMPVRALASLLDLMAEVRPRLPEIDRPALLAHGVNDHTVPYGCLAELAARLGTPRDALRCLSLPRSYHLLTLDIERAPLFDAIAEHLGRHLA